VLRKADGRHYALKVMSFASKEALPRLLNEVRLLASFQNVPFILNYRDSFIERGRLYLLTDLAEQGDL
jgi:NIMA (never in mitosis gene a)-related kinase